MSWVAHLLNVTNDLVATLPAVLAALLLGSKLFYAAGLEVIQRRVSSSSLAALAILASMAVEKYGTAAFLAFILLVADLIVSRTADGAKRAIEQLVSLTPNIARVVMGGVEKIIPVGEVQVGQTVRIRPGENLPVDGRVTSGESTINQASLTGEAMPVEVQRGSDVYAGTSNLTGAIDIEVTQVGEGHHDRKGLRAHPRSRIHQDPAPAPYRAGRPVLCPRRALRRAGRVLPDLAERCAGRQGLRPHCVR